MRALTLLPLILLFAGCPKDGQVCTEIAVGSVTLTVVESDGDPIEGATARWSTDDASGDCDATGATFTCGYEITGAITITASAPGRADASTTVTVEDDGCHPIPEAVELTLEAECLDDAILRSIRATITSAASMPLDNLLVQYGPPAGAMSDCQEEANGVWSCGDEEAGTFTVTASADGHQPASQEVTVEQGDCHVITEEISFALEALPN